jgi:hypothetical protein
MEQSRYRTVPAMSATDRTAPRALFRRPLISIKVTPFELSLLIERLQARALVAADDPDMIDFADYLFGRIAELREAGR